MNSFSNLYPCPWNNGSYTINWCCGARESAEEGEPGCCDDPLFTQGAGVIGRVIVTLASSSSSAPSSSPASLTPRSEAGKTADRNTSTLKFSASHLATSSSSVPFSTSPTLSESTISPTPTPLKSSSHPAQPFHKGLAIGTGIGVPVAVLLLFGQSFLLLRERRQRIRAQKIADHAETAAKMKEAERRSTPATDCALCHHHLPQEIDGVPHGPKEIDSQAVYEANGSF